MLRSLYISNYAIIDQVKLEFNEGLTIITGETGAGKSILLGALGLILGRRADTSVLYNAEKKCIVEATFDVSLYNLQEIFKTHELDYEKESIIRREINANGKSRAFINDTPVTLVVLKDISDHLIDLHQQFDTLAINSEKLQMEILDVVASQVSSVEDYYLQYKAYAKNLQVLKKMKEQSKAAIQEMDFLRFQVEELNTLSLEKGEVDILESELKRSKSSEDLKMAGNLLAQSLSESPNNIIDLLIEAAKPLEKIIEIDKEAAELYSRLNGIKEDLYDISKGGSLLADKADFDPQAIHETEERLNDIYRLLNKHRVQTDNELIEIQEVLSTKLLGFESLDDDIARHEATLAKTKGNLEEKAASISKGRARVKFQIQDQVKDILNKVSMPNASLNISIEERETLNSNGIDEVTFLFSANKGMPPLPLHKVASGGELSRLNLAIKSIVAENITLPTLIFDEIDTGVSGNVAMEMGKLLAKLSRDHQTIVITHSPQVASRGDHHYYIYKEDTEDRTLTHLKTLNSEERLVEIATMLSGNPPSSEAKQNAKTLLLKK